MKKRYKTITALVLAAAMLAALCSCSALEISLSGDSGDSSISGLLPEELNNIELSGNSSNGKGTTAENNMDNMPSVDSASALKGSTITSGGSYVISGDYSGMITIDAKGADVTLVLDGANVTNPDGPALYVKAASNVYIYVKEGTVNTFADGSSYSITADDSNLDACIFSKADLYITGGGTLYVNGNNKHGIVSKDDLVIDGPSLTVNAKKSAIEGKDYLEIDSGTIVVTAGSDGIRTTNDEDPAKANLVINGGSIKITAGNDGIQSETTLTVNGGTLDITAGGGSTKKLSSSSESYKGLKAETDLVVNAGQITISSADDCVHSNSNVYINGGTLALSSGDDGVHADTKLEIKGGTVDVSQSYEGLEAASVIISGGNISVKATDDGINGAGGNDGSAQTSRPGMGRFSKSTGSITISGGTVYVNAAGDGIDSNGSLTISSGTVTVDGPRSGAGNSALDHDGTFTISGGTVLGFGSSGMLEGVNASQNQATVSANISGSAGSKIVITDASGKEIVSATANKTFQNITVSAPSIQVGGSIVISVDGSKTTIEVTSAVTNYGSGSGGGKGGGNWWGRPGGTDQDGTDRNNRNKNNRNNDTDGTDTGTGQGPWT